jgi:Glycosyltransferase family 87
MPISFHKISSRQITGVFILAAAGITIQTWLAGHGKYTRYNNYVLFERSFGHLIQHKDLYIFYPQEYYDLFKYSPSFAFLMGIFYIMPHFIGLLLFNLLNVGIFIWSVRKLKFPEKTLRLLLLYVLLEACISITSAQTNLLMTGLIILGFAFLEEDKPGAAALCIVLTVFIKIFGAVAFVLWILYPKKIKFLLYALMWMIVIAALPMIVISKSDLFHQYQSWWELLRADQDVSYGASLMGLLHSWFSVKISKEWITIAGAALFMIPFVKYNCYRLYTFRLQILASLLIWMVIFNHKAESPTYIIAMTGVAIWYFSQPPRRINRILLWGCLIFTSFSSTDLITPNWIKNQYIEPYAVKAVFSTIIWVKLLWDLLTEKSLRPYLINNTDPSR